MSRKTAASGPKRSMVALVMVQGLLGSFTRHLQPLSQSLGEIVDRHPQDLGPHPQRMRAALLPRLVGERAEKRQQPRQGSLLVLGPKVVDDREVDEVAADSDQLLGEAGQQGFQQPRVGVGELLSQALLRLL